jgi:hypothetical protein
LLYQTVQTHWRQFRSDIERDGDEIPGFLRDEFEAYLRCGILTNASVQGLVATGPRRLLASLWPWAGHFA